jgi:hypothetical protein
MVDKNDTLLREVEDELRQDRLRKLWDRYGTYVVGGLAAFIVGLFIYQQVEASRVAAEQAAGARFEAARRLLADKKDGEAQAALSDIGKNGPGGYAALARLQQAGTYVKADKTTEAVAAYDAVAGDSATDAVLRDFARLQAAGLRLGAADWTEMQNRLSTLIDERNAFRVNARELLGLAARSAAKTDEARKLFLQVLGDSKASPAIKERVNGYMSSLVAADLAKVDAVPVAPAVPAEAPKK